MSQKLTIVSVKYEGTPFFLGFDKQGNEMFTRHGERVMEYLADGWRFTYNLYRGARHKWAPVEDAEGKFTGEYENIGFLGSGPSELLPEAVPVFKDGEPVLRKDGTHATTQGCIPQAALKERYAFLRNMPTPVGNSAFIRLWENSDWSSNLKLRKTMRAKGLKASAAGMKKRKDGLTFKVQPVNLNKMVRVIKSKYAEITISGLLDKRHSSKGSKWSLRIKVRTHQPLVIPKPGATVMVNWTERTLAIAGVPKPLKRADNPRPIVGLDRGVTRTLASSEGVWYDIPKPTKEAEKQYQDGQRKIDVKVKGSKNYKKLRARLNKSVAVMARRRDYWTSVVSTELVRNFDTIVLEDLDVKKMTEKKKGKSSKTLNRHILESSWGDLRSKLEYKAALVGGTVGSVNPAYTSQACNKCHHVTKENRKSQSKFACVKCGHVDNADINAAKNIRDSFLGKLALPERTSQ